MTTFIASLRKSLEDVEAEARRRIGELPDGTYRVNFFSDSTLRENVLLKYPCAITVEGDRMIVDWRGDRSAVSESGLQRDARCGEVVNLAGDPRLFLAGPATRDQRDEPDRGPDRPKAALSIPASTHHSDRASKAASTAFSGTQALLAKLHYSVPEVRR